MLSVIDVAQVNGERHPGDVYKDFREAVMRILGMQDNPPNFTNGKEASIPADVTVELPIMVSGSLLSLKILMMNSLPARHTNKEFRATNSSSHSLAEQNHQREFSR